jgi:serine/threonine protein kinase
MSVQGAKKRKIFDGRYEVIAIVGRGSDSVVYHARHLDGPQQEVALKVLINNSKAKTSVSERLRKEALTLVSCRHKFVVRLDDFHSVSDLCYLSMEYAPLGDLRKYLTATGKPLSPEFGSRALEQALEGIDFIHATGVLHRDLKPDNILVLNENEIRLADFGLALLPGDELDLEELQNGVGSLAYLPPEMLEGKGYDTRSDLYSLGVCFYEALSGKHPFESASLADQLSARKDGAIQQLHEINPAIPTHISAVISKLMRYSPEDRFQSAMEAIRALANTSFTDQPKGTSATSALGDEFDDLFDDDEDLDPSMYRAENQDSLKSDVDHFFDLDADDDFDIFSEPPPQAAEPSTSERATRPTEELPMERIQQLVDQDAKQQEILAERNSKIEDEVADYAHTEDDFSDIPARHVSEKAAQRNSLVPSFILRLPPFARPLVVGLLAAFATITIIGIYSSTPKHLISLPFSDSSAPDQESASASSEVVGDTGFPHVEAGTYAGSITGILPGITSPLALISRPEHNELTIVVGIEGWSPVSVSTSREDGEEPSPTIVARSEGVLLNMTGEVSSDAIIGTFTNAITGESGTWVVRKVS